MLLSTLVKAWMAVKGWRSRERARIQFRRALPAFASLGEMENYRTANMEYTPDGLGGLDDRYTHPEVIHFYAVRNQEAPLDWRGDPEAWPIECDCDDFAAFGYAAAQGIPGVKSVQMVVWRYPSMFALAQDLVANIRAGSPYWLYFHESVLIETEADGLYVFDANGLQRVEGDVDDLFFKWYGKRLVTQPTPYPFT